MAGNKGKKKVMEAESTKNTSKITRSKRSKKGESSLSKPTKKQKQEARIKDIPKYHEENIYRIHWMGEPGSQREKEHKKKYDVVHHRGMVSTRFLDCDLMGRLGFAENLHWMYEKLGMGKLWGVRYNTYPKYVLEFFSTVEIHNQWFDKIDDRKIRFRCNGVTFRFTAKEFNKIYGFHTDGVTKSENDLVGSNMWDLIAPHRMSAPGAAKCTSITNPVFRCFQKAIANTILARSDSQNAMRTEELYFMWACFNSTEKVDVGFHFLDQLSRIANRINGKITIGGMLTPLFIHCEADLTNEETAKGSNVLGYNVFDAANLLVTSGNSIYLKNPYLRLPCTSKTDIFNKENWLLEATDANAMDEDDANDGDDDEENEEHEDEEEYVPELYGMDDMRTTIREIQEEQQRQSELLKQVQQQQNQLGARFDTMYTWNEAIYHHFFPPPPPPPTE